VHKNSIIADRTWVHNDHNVDNSFWVATFCAEVSAEDLIAAAKDMNRVMDEQAVTTREEDVKRAPSISRPFLWRLLRLTLSNTLIDSCGCWK